MLLPEQVTAIERAMEGDARSFQLVFSFSMARVRSVAFRLGAGADLDDVVQEIFVRVWKGLPRLTSAAAFSTWLYRVAVNATMDALRARASRPGLTTVNRDAARLPANTASTTTQLVVSEALAQLSEEHRTVLVLHDLEDFTEALS